MSAGFSWSSDARAGSVLADAAGHHWDFLLAGTWTIRDPRAFLGAGATVTPDVPLYPAVAQSWIASRVRGRVADELRGKEIDYLRGSDGLPASWWEKRFGEWLAPADMMRLVAEAP